jgi:hypothetical protein
MQITLNHREIEEAIIEYVSNQGISIQGKSTEVAMVAGRGSNGYSATVDILADNLVVTPEQQADPVTPTVEFTDEDTDTPDEPSDTLFGN